MTCLGQENMISKAVPCILGIVRIVPTSIEIFKINWTSLALQMIVALNGKSLRLRYQRKFVSIQISGDS